MGAFESGASFMAGVLAKLPESQREQAKAIFESAEAKEAVTLIGDGALARSDYSRHMDGLREKEGQVNDYYLRLNGWFEDNKGALEEARELRQHQAQPAPAGAGNGNGDQGLRSPALPAQPAPAPAGQPTFTVDDVRRIADEAVNAAGRDYIALSGFLATQAGRHQALFGEPLDALDLVNHPKLGRPVMGQPGRVFSLQDAYMEKYGERVVAKQKEFEEKRFNEEVDRRLADRVKAQTGHPFPMRGAEASPLDALSQKDGSALYTVDAAVAEYERLQAARGA